jgi:nitroreductase/NAD-dependent dihydropyrimidine dehydrogenase PreA subunit
MLENSKIIIDIDSCDKCRACVNECHYYYFESDVLHVTKEMDEECQECGKCVAVCPNNLIRLKVYEEEVLKDYPAKEEIPSFESLTYLFQSRRSRRQFKKEMVSKELIEKILNTAGRYSATGHNQENVYFTVVQDRELLERLSSECNNQVKNLVEKFEDPQGRKSLKSVFSPELMKTVEEVIPSFRRKLKRVEAGEEVWRWDAELIIFHSPKDAGTLVENCTLAAGQVMLAAETLGLGTCSLGYLTEFFKIFRSAAKIVKLPLKHIVGYTLAIGYPKARYYRIPARKALKAKWM